MNRERRQTRVEGREDQPVEVDGERAERSVAVEVGNENFEPGFARVELMGDGSLLIQRRLYGKESASEGRIEPDRARRLMELAEHQTNELQVRELDVEPRPGIPDEPRYRVELYERGQRRQTIELWRSELEERPELQRMVGELQEVVNEFSGEEVVL